MTESENDSQSRRFDRIHVYGGARMLAHIGEATQARFAGREFAVLDDEAAFIEALPEIEILTGFGVPKGHWAAAERLRLIQWFGAGVDGLLPAVGLPEQVLVTNASGTHEPQLPEFVMAALFTMSYRMHDLDRQQREHTWKIAFPRPVAGRTMCIVGVGTIGQSIARRATAMGMRVVGVRRSGAPVDGVEQIATPADRLDVIRNADVLVMITPLTSETRGLIGAEELAALAPGAMLIDVGRGGIVDLDAVVAALKSEHLSAATVDVFPTEPLPPESPLWAVENLHITPHTSGWSRDYTDRLFSTLADSVEAIERGDEPATLVDRTLGY